MSYFMIVAIGFLFALCLQFVFQMWQMKSFNIYYGKLRRKGRVAIGKSKGGFYAGAIVMFAIDQDGIIIDGSYMQGFTMLAKFKPWDRFNGYDVGGFTLENSKELPVPLRRAVADASSNYNVIMSGGEIEQKQGPISSALSKVSNVVYGSSKKSA